MTTPKRLGSETVAGGFSWRKKPPEFPLGKNSHWDNKVTPPRKDKKVKQV